MAACSSSTRPATARSTFALAAISYPKAAYVLVSGYIQGDIKFASNSISGAVTQALLSLNPYGLPLFGNEVSIYGYGTAIGALDDSDADAGTLLGILILPANLGFGEDVYFDVTTFVAGTNAPFLAFNLRTTDTDVFSSLEFNYGHASQLLVTTTAVAEPAPGALLLAGLAALGGVARRRPVASPRTRRQCSLSTTTGRRPARRRPLGLVSMAFLEAA